MKNKWTTIWMIFVSILSLQGVAARTITMYSTNEDFIAAFNKNQRMPIMKQHELPDVKELIYDNGLANIAKTVSCELTPPAGYRVFWTPNNDASVIFEYDELDEFVETAHEDVDLALRQLGNFPGLIEAISVNQKRVGCAYKKCTLAVYRPLKWAGNYTNSAICVLGPKGTLTAEDVPFQRDLYLRGSVVHTFEKYIDGLNEERMKIMRDHGLNGVPKLTYDAGLARKAADVPDSFYDDNLYNAFRVSAEAVSGKYWYSELDKFLDLAHRDVDQAIHRDGNWFQLINTIHIGQHSIGCAWRKRKSESKNRDLNNYVFSAVCVVGPEKEFKAEHFPFRQGPPLPEEE